MQEHTKKAAAAGTGATIAFLGYQYMELSRQNYELAQRVAKLEARNEFLHGESSPAEQEVEEAAAAEPLTKR